MKILVTGGTGFLGHQLLNALIEKNHELVLTSRKQNISFQPFPAQIIEWPIDFNKSKDSLQTIDAVIHLAGENIADGRWSEERKKAILNSRVSGTQSVVDLIRRLPTIKTFISSSAIGYYGDNKKDELTEDSPAGRGFLAEVCKAWEDEAHRADRPDLRTVILRTGVVLGRASGVLGKMEPLYRNKVGGPIGSGEQFMSWIHERDWVRAVIHCLENKSLTGPVNLTAPQPVSNKGFSREMAKLFKQPVQIPAPAIALKLAMGEMAAIALEGQFALPKKLQDSNFSFEFNELERALENLYDIHPESPDKIHTPDDLFACTQWVPRPPNEVFQFFCDETNLEALTPPLLNFHVRNKSTQKIGKGTLINYDLKIRGIPLTWQTLIDDWRPPHQFTDEQLKGPYKKWLHTHTFAPACGGTLMRDRIRYRLPLGAFGRIGGHWLVRKDIEKIFNYRRSVIREMFKANT
ncbi:MAG: TIGR01777 family oxidoreductase [Bdellovibrionota bacterium]